KQILALLLIIFALGACTASPEAMARWEQEEADRKAAIEAALAAKEDREKSEAERLADLVFSHPSVSTFDEAWALPDSQFDLGLAYLLFAKDHGDQDFEISTYLKAI